MKRLFRELLKAHFYFSYYMEKSFQTKSWRRGALPRSGASVGVVYGFFLLGLLGQMSNLLLWLGIDLNKYTNGNLYVIFGGISLVVVMSISFLFDSLYDENRMKYVQWEGSQKKWRNWLSRLFIIFSVVNWIISFTVLVRILK